MAEWQWKFELQKKHILKVKWTFFGMATMTLDRKILAEEDSKLFFHEFRVENAFCYVKFANEDQIFNYQKLTIWAPQFFVDGKFVKTSTSYQKLI